MYLGICTPSWELRCAKIRELEICENVWKQFALKSWENVWKQFTLNVETVYLNR